MASNIIMDETYKVRPIRIYQGIAPTLRSSQCGAFEVLDNKKEDTKWEQEQTIPDYKN